MSSRNPESQSHEKQIQGQVPVRTFGQRQPSLRTWLHLNERLRGACGGKYFRWLLRAATAGACSLAYRRLLAHQRSSSFQNSHMMLH